MTPPKYLQKSYPQVAFAVLPRIPNQPLPPEESDASRNQKEILRGGGGQIAKDTPRFKVGEEPQTQRPGNLFAYFGRGHLRTRTYNKLTP